MSFSALQKKWLRFVWEKSPRDLYFLVRRKLRGRSRFSYDVPALLASAKYMDPVKLVDRLCRYERALMQRQEWQPLDFQDQNVLEIGAGPLLGWGPMAVFLGCRRFVFVESAYDPEVLKSEALWQKYFVPHYRQLCAIFGERMTLAEFRQRLALRIQCLSGYFENADLPAAEFDVVLSNSVLEHVQDLEAFSKNLKRVLSPRARQLHAVDFGNHLMTANPFEGIYSQSREDALKNYAKNLNLLKPSEILHIFRNNGLDTTLVPYLQLDPPALQDCHPSWRHIDPSELAMGVALITEKAPGA